MFEKLSEGLVSIAGVDHIAAQAVGMGSRIERSAIAVMLSPVQDRFKVELWGSTMKLWDHSVTSSKDLFLPAKEGEAVNEGNRVTPSDSR